MIVAILVFFFELIKKNILYKHIKK